MEHSDSGTLVTSWLRQLIITILALYRFNLQDDIDEPLVFFLF